MLTDQSFNDKPTIWLGIDMFYLKGGTVVDFESCFAFRNHEKLHSMFRFQGIHLASQAEAYQRIEDIVPINIPLILPDAPTAVSHRQWRYVCRTAFCIYSPSVVEQYRHIATTVLPSSSNTEVVTALFSLTEIDFI